MSKTPTAELADRPGRRIFGGGQARVLRAGRQGFTLVEVLVVIVVIGILAAIALPSLLGQRVKAQDSAAQSDAANGVVQVESCFVERQSYVGCTLADSGLPNAVSVTGQTEDTYTVRSVSESGNAYSVAHRNGRPDSRTCTVTGGSTAGACDSSLLW